jgi:hypothetical protein
MNITIVHSGDILCISEFINAEGTAASNAIIMIIMMRKGKNSLTR